MAAYFLDSSALVKRYVAEVGSGWVSSLLLPAQRHRIYIARIALVEVTSALHRRVKGGSVTSTDALAAQSQLEFDAGWMFRLVEMRAEVLDLAAALAAKHALRAYDAVQLASATVVNRRRVARSLTPLCFVASDRQLDKTAEMEGFAVEDPNDHP